MQNLDAGEEEEMTGNGIVLLFVWCFGGYCLFWLGLLKHLPRAYRDGDSWVISILSLITGPVVWFAVGGHLPRRKK